MQSLYKVIPMSSITSSTRSSFKYLPKQTLVDKTFVPELSNGKRPWLMNEMDTTNIIQISGCQLLELYDPNKKKADFFTVKPMTLYKNGKLRYNGLYLMEISPSVFFRFMIAKKGSSNVSPVCYETINEDRYLGMYKPIGPLDKPIGPLDEPSSPLDKQSSPLDKQSSPLDKLSSPLDKLSSPLDKLSSLSGIHSGLSDISSGPINKPYHWKGKQLDIDDLPELDIDDLPDYDLEVNPALISNWEQSLPKKIN